MKKEKEIKNEKIHAIHITHNDADAVGCALVLSYILCNYDYENNTHFCAIGTADKKILDIMTKIENKEEPVPSYIIISDIALTEKTCEILEEFSDKYNITLLGFDHHESNNLDTKFKWWFIKKKPYLVKYDDTTGDAYLSKVSAAYVIFDYFYNILPARSEAFADIHNIICLISDYDTWEWKNHKPTYTNESIRAGIVGIVCSILGPEKMFGHLLEYYDGKTKNFMFPPLFYSLYYIEIDNRDEYLKSIEQKTKIYEHNNFRFALYISENKYTNAVADYLYNKYKFIDIVIIIYPSSKTLGFRTNKSNIDLSQIAKKYYNGDGHKSAAGGKIEDDSQFVDFLKIFYLKATPLNEYITN